MSGNPPGFRSSGRYAPLLTFRVVGTALVAFHKRRPGGHKAAGRSRAKPGCQDDARLAKV